MNQWRCWQSFLPGSLGSLVSISRRSSLVAPGSLLPRRQNAHKKHCAAHSVLFKFPRDHLSQLFYPGWLLHAKALQQSVWHLAAIGFCTSTNTILKIKKDPIPSYFSLPSPAYFYGTTSFFFWSSKCVGISHKAAGQFSVIGLKKKSFFKVVDYRL